MEDTDIASNEMGEEAVQETEAAIEGDETQAGEQQPAEQETENTDQSDDGEFVPFPKKAKNAISRRDRQIAKLQAKIRQIEQAQAQPQNVAEPAPKQTGEPKEENFDNYADFLEAKVMHNLRQEMLSKQDEAKATQEDQQQAAQYEQEAAHKMRESVLAHEKQNPGFQKQFQEVVAENAELMSYMSPEIERAFFEADDAALAFFNLANDGRLGEVMQMTPYRAAMEIAKAQVQPAPTPNKAPPPAPIRGAKGTGKTQRGLADLEGEELLQRLESLAAS